jgi:hypothetical protein
VAIVDNGADLGSYDSLVQYLKEDKKEINSHDDISLIIVGIGITEAIVKQY